MKQARATEPIHVSFLVPTRNVRPKRRATAYVTAVYSINDGRERSASRIRRTLAAGLARNEPTPFFVSRQQGGWGIDWVGGWRPRTMLSR